MPKAPPKKSVVFQPSDLPHFEELILRKKEELMKELGYLKETTLEKSYTDYTGEVSTYSYHMADQGTDAQEREKAFMFASREGKYLTYLDRALEMIKNKTYGYCQSCSQPISRARLEAVPTARLCIDCKSKEEKVG